MGNSRPVTEWTDNDGHLEEHVLDIVWDNKTSAWLVVCPNRILRLHPNGGNRRGEETDPKGQGQRA